MTASVVVRPPSSNDLVGLAALLGELGYPASAPAVQARLDRLARHAHAVVLVADRDGAAIGLATRHVLDVIYTDEPVAMLTTLVVDERHRGRGVGRRLVETVEAWAIRCGATRITVATRHSRDVAHAVYEKLGYEHTARRYSKILER